MASRVISGMRHISLALILLVAAASDSLLGHLAASPWNVIEAGAAADGAGDCTALFQRLLDRAGAAGGGVVVVPAGRYRIAGGLAVPANVTLQGIYRVPPTTGPRTITNLTGSVLFAHAGRGTTNGAPFIRLAGNNAAFGVTYDPKNPCCEWINTQGVAFELARTDWQYVLNTFCFGYGIGYKFSESKAGSANGNFLGLGADSCQRAVVVDQAQPPGLLISNGEFVVRWSSTNAVCLEVGPDVEGKVSLVNCSFWGPIDRCVWMRSAAGQFTASACNFVHWDNRGVGSAAVQLDAGKAIVQGCTFGQDNSHVQVGSNVVSAILTANQAAGGFRVENLAGRLAQIALNEEDPNAWTPEARAHYHIEVGESGDARYLQGWHGPEGAGRPFRWSTAESRFLLPVVAGQSYTVVLEADVPEQAMSPEAGLYLDSGRLSPLKSGTPLIATLPASTEERSPLFELPAAPPASPGHRFAWHVVLLVAATQS